AGPDDSNMCERPWRTLPGRRTAGTEGYKDSQDPRCGVLEYFSRVARICGRIATNFLARSALNPCDRVLDGPGFLVGSQRVENGNPPSSPTDADSKGESAELRRCTVKTTLHGAPSKLTIPFLPMLLYNPHRSGRMSCKPLFWLWTILQAISPC